MSAIQRAIVRTAGAPAAPTDTAESQTLPSLSRGAGPYRGRPRASASTRPPQIARAQGIVMSMTVDPASAPTPTSRFSCASGPKPLKSTSAPSGTAPSTGRMQDPTSLL